MKSEDNTFNVGDKFTVNKITMITRDCTLGKVYTAIHVGTGHGQAGGESGLDVQFIDDVGDTVVSRYDSLTKVEA